jgi:hypothetical protein
MSLTKIASLCALIGIFGCVSNEEKESAAPFKKDAGTVFLADFNGNLIDQVSGVNGKVTAGTFSESVFGKSIRFAPPIDSTPGFLFPNSSALSVDPNSIEVLVYTEGNSTGFMHLVDKSWQYGLSIHNGKVAVDFGTTWWHSKYAIPSEKWTYLCGSFDGETIRLFANGSLVDSSAYARKNGDASWDLGIGNASDSFFYAPFIGRIDEVRISQKVRSATEIFATWKAIEKKIPD